MLESTLKWYSHLPGFKEKIHEKIESEKRRYAAALQDSERGRSEERK